jgi:hypothetical protein
MRFGQFGWCGTRIMTRDFSHRVPTRTALLDGVFSLDFEASSLDAAGYPIEVGIVEVSTNLTLSWLIRPTAEWRERGVWDKAAQAVHGITPAELETRGITPAEVTQALSDKLIGKRVLSDHPDFDTRWLWQLYKAAGAGAPRFEIGDVEIYAWRLVRVRGRIPHVAFQKAEIAARMAFPVRHRAGPDAQHNAELLRQLCGAEATRGDGPDGSGER